MKGGKWCDRDRSGQQGKIIIDGSGGSNGYFKRGKIDREADKDEISHFLFSGRLYCFHNSRSFTVGCKILLNPS